jgi:hypothetical protein
MNKLPPAYDPCPGHLVRRHGRLVERWVGPHGMVVTRNPELAQRAVEAWHYAQAERLLREED